MPCTQLFIRYTYRLDIALINLIIVFSIYIYIMKSLVNYCYKDKDLSLCLLATDQLLTVGRNNIKYI